MADVYVAAQTAVVDDNGTPVRIRKGVTRIEAGHPLLKANPDLFKPADEDVRFRTKTTKAEPKVAPAQTQKQPKSST